MSPLRCVCLVRQYPAGYWFALLITRSRDQVVMSSDGDYKTAENARVKCEEWLSTGRADKYVGEQPVEPEFLQT